MNFGMREMKDRFKKKMKEDASTMPAEASGIAADATPSEVINASTGRAKVAGIEAASPTARQAQANAAAAAPQVQVQVLESGPYLQQPSGVEMIQIQLLQAILEELRKLNQSGVEEA